jgi:S-adenosylmethionine:tRNA ribosyltransferase-isomerase
MDVALFDFDLPEERIALRPVEPRDAARMLVVQPHGSAAAAGGQTLTDSAVKQLTSWLKPGDALVFNDTRVIPGQLEGHRTRDGWRVDVSATLHLREAANVWRAFLKPGRRVKPGDTLIFGDGLEAVAGEKGETGDVPLTFSVSGAALDEAIKARGAMPLPPYIAAKRGQDGRDATDYQTVYAREDGAVAAPTAGLHFSDQLLAMIDAAGIERHFVTLHVGAGTFLPVKADDTKDHKMHAEIGVITPETANALNQVRARGGRIVAVGTTSLRLLETATDSKGIVKPFSGSTNIFITPGYKFRCVDALMTNFHLPKSTLFMLVSAFCGIETMQAAYAHAVSNQYRFYSYGDSSLLFRALK